MEVSRLTNPNTGQFADALDQLKQGTIAYVADPTVTNQWYVRDPSHPLSVRTTNVPPFQISPPSTGGAISTVPGSITSSTLPPFNFVMGSSSQTSSSSSNPFFESTPVTAARNVIPPSTLTSASSPQSVPTQPGQHSSGGQAQPTRSQKKKSATQSTSQHVTGPSSNPSLGTNSQVSPPPPVPSSTPSLPSTPANVTEGSQPTVTTQPAPTTANGLTSSKKTKKNGKK